MYAHVVINQNGIARAYIPNQYQIDKREKVNIVKPEIALNKLIEMYENTILTGKIVIDNIELYFAQIAVENSLKSELDIQYVISPVWKFSVSKEEAGEAIGDNVLYDAIMGERVGR